MTGPQALVLSALALGIVGWIVLAAGLPGLALCDFIAAGALLLAGWTR